MGALYVDTGGATTNSGSRDANTAAFTGTNATVSGSVVTLDGSPDLSGVQTSGAAQDSIHLDQATNSNLKIFWITAVDNVGKTVTVHVAPTGVTGSNWAIGGRHVLTNASIEGALRAGDEVIFNNSPASAAATRWTFRNSGDTTSGMAKIRGATGVRPVLTTTNTNTAIVFNSTPALCAVENLEIQQQGASGNAFGSFGAGEVIYNVKVSDSGGNTIQTGTAGAKIINSEISGAGGDAWNTSATGMMWGCYVHDNTGDGVEVTTASANGAVGFSIFDSNAGRGIYLSGAATSQANALTLWHNTVYANLGGGLEAADGDYSPLLVGNIFKDNGDAAGEFNIEWPSSFQFVSMGLYNCFHQAGGSAGNLSGYTAHSTDITTDPLFVDAAAGDFALQSTSPCKATAFPGAFLGGPTGYLDMGAVQRQEPAGGGGLLTHPGMSGGMRG